MSLVDPGCSALAASFMRRNLRAPRAGSVGARRPPFRRKGSSFDLRSIREYQYFDDPRAIDWRLYGRCGRAYVKEYYEELGERVAILLDSSASMALAEREACLAMAASLGYLAAALGIGALCRFFDGRGLGPGVELHRSADLAALERLLDRWEPAGGSGYDRALAALEARGEARRVVLVSDFHEAAFRYRPAVGSLLFLIRAALPLAGPDGELLVRDPESGAERAEPWDRAAREAWRSAELALDRRLSSLGRGVAYRRLDPGSEAGARIGLYRDFLELLYA